MRATGFAALVSLTPLIVGCTADPCAGLSGTCVALAVNSAHIARVDSVDVVATGAINGSHKTAANESQMLPFKIALRFPSSASGAVHLQVDGRLANTIVGSGIANGTIVPGAHTTLSVDIEAPTEIGTADMAQESTADLSTSDMTVTGTVTDMSANDMAKNPPPPDLYKSVWHIENGGVGTTDLFGVAGSSASDVYVVGASGTILHRDATGTWSPQVSGFASSTLLRVWESPGGFLYVVGLNGSNGLILFSKGNASWTQQYVSGLANTPPLDGVSGTADNDISAVGPGGALVHTTGGSGISWQLLALPGSPTNGLFGVGGAASIGKTFACGEAGECVTHAGGTNVTVIPNTTTGTQQNLNGTAVTTLGELYAAGVGGTMIHMTAAGVFSPVNSHAATDLNGVSISPSEGYAVGLAGTIIRSVAGGAWGSDTANVAVGTVIPANDLQTVWQASNGEVFAVGKQGTILHRY